MQRLRFLFLLLLSIIGISSTYVQQSGYLPFNGGRLYYQVSGQGAPLIFVHAGFQDHRMWQQQVQHFSRQYKVITFDLPGHGLTVAGNERPLAAEVVKAVMDGLNIDRAALVGLSLGGAISIDFALQYPQRVTKLVLAGSGLPGWDENRKVDTTTTQYITALFDALNKKDTAEAATIFVKSWYAGPERSINDFPKSLRDSGYATTYQNMLRHKVSGWPRFTQPTAIHRLPQLQKPLLILTGTIDMPEVLLMNRWLKENVKGAQQVLMPGLAHMLNLEDPAQFNKLIEDFLQQK